MTLIKKQCAHTVSDADRPRCPHCNVQQFDNPNADPALASLAAYCWKCCKRIANETEH